MNATPIWPSHKNLNQWQGAQADPKQKQDRAKTEHGHFDDDWGKNVNARVLTDKSGRTTDINDSKIDKYRIP
jgi:hypothetical protein